MSAISILGIKTRKTSLEKIGETKTKLEELSFKLKSSKEELEKMEKMLVDIKRPKLRLVK